MMMESEWMSRDIWMNDSMVDFYLIEVSEVVRNDIRQKTLHAVLHVEKKNKEHRFWHFMLDFNL